MIERRFFGFLYLAAGLFCIFFFASRWILEILAIMVGIKLIFSGLEQLAFFPAGQHKNSYSDDRRDC